MRSYPELEVRNHKQPYIFSGVEVGITRIFKLLLGILVQFLLSSLVVASYSINSY